MRTTLCAALLLFVPGTLVAQGRDEEFYLPGRFNWAFLRTYPHAARLFNAFDYGHAVLYERLYTAPGAPVAVLEEKEFDFLTRDLLIRPPRFAVAEEAIMPQYSRMAWRAKMMFERAHVLHRQLYDVYADERLPAEEKGPLVERLTDHYLADPYAFTDKPKTMELMDDQFFSQEFREKYPRFNGLIWAYHWLQVGLYEPLLRDVDAEAKRQGVARTVARFQSLISDIPGTAPSVMPMTSGVAPTFSERHPRAAIVFDNLHMMHDIISDILASPKVPRADKGREIEKALDEFQRSDRNVMDPAHWRMMADHMGGVEKMGGVAGQPVRPR